MQQALCPPVNAEMAGISATTAKGSAGVALGCLSFPWGFVCLLGAASCQLCTCQAASATAGHLGGQVPWCSSLSLETELIPAALGQLVPCFFLALKIWGRWGSESQGTRRKAGLGQAARMCMGAEK